MGGKPDGSENDHDGHKSKMRLQVWRTCPNGPKTNDRLSEELNGCADSSVSVVFSSTQGIWLILCYVSHATVLSPLDNFVDLGLLAETTGRRRNRRYLFADYVELFPHD